MKKLALGFIFLLAGCHAEDASPTLPTMDDFDTTTFTLLKQGNLEGVNHTASGVASVFEKEGNAVVLLDPYASQNGPDLKIYLSKDVDASEYIRLGNLKSTSGKQSYAIPKGTDLQLYHYVHVWCEKYTVVFARAELK